MTVFLIPQQNWLRKWIKNNLCSTFCGRAYGISKYSWPEKHEKKISDKYLTWGWKETK